MQEKRRGRDDPGPLEDTDAGTTSAHNNDTIMQSMNNQLLTIVWDVDDVLNSLTAAWLDSYNRKSAANFAYKELAANPPHQILGISLEEYLSSLDNFRVKYYETLEPVPGVLDWFEQHGHLSRHVALSAVPMKSAAISAEWTLRHFGHWIRSFHFVPSKRKDDDHSMYDSDKASFLAWLGNADILVEDNEDNAEAANKLGIETILFPQPWNSKADGSVQEALNRLCGAVKSGGMSSRHGHQVGQGRPAPAVKSGGMTSRHAQSCGAMTSRHSRLIPSGSSRPDKECVGSSSRLARDSSSSLNGRPPKGLISASRREYADAGTSSAYTNDAGGETTPAHSLNADAGTSSAHGGFTAPDWDSLETRFGPDLPHWNCDIAIYHVVMRLADSLPKDVLASWGHERNTILDHAKHLGRKLTSDENKRLQHLFSKEVECCLDRSVGKCWLRIPQIAGIVQDALRHGDGEKYKLHAWCVMPSHVHVMIEPLQGRKLYDIVRSWSSFTGRSANRALDRHGRFWQTEPYDHIIRDEHEYAAQLEYIYRNPEKIGITDWPWRFRH